MQHAALVKRRNGCNHEANKEEKKSSRINYKSGLCLGMGNGRFKFWACIVL